MRVLMDYRSALRGRSGAGEYAHHLMRALLAQNGETARVDATIFSSSWKDRLIVPPDLAGVHAIDRRVPVSLLNFAWHRLEWPPVEQLARQDFDVVHSMHPLMMPARRAAQVVTIHDINFMTHPERTRREMRRDYPALAENHARRACRIVVPSTFTAREIERTFDINVPKISICPPGAPDWPPRTTAPAKGYVLFLGTLEPRKNLGTLLDAYERLLARGTERVPDLVLAGHATGDAQPWLDRIARPPLAAHVRAVGYVDTDARLAFFDGARMLVQPSFEEGFGIPVLEAMTRGVPVVAANRGALPEVLGDAGVLFDAASAEDLANAIWNMATNDPLARASTEKGLARSRQFQWSTTAALVIDAYEQAIAYRQRLDIIDPGPHHHH